MVVESFERSVRYATQSRGASRSNNRVRCDRLNDGDLSNLKVSPNFSFFPFMDLVSNMVGGLWALSLYIAVGAWICAAIAWIAGRVIHSGPMQQYSGTVFIWCALATMILGAPWLS